MSITSNSGKIETIRVVGEVHATTLTGNIEIGPVDGDVTLGLNSARIRNRYSREDLHAKSLTGNLKIGPVDGDATVRSNAGHIQTGYVRGKLIAMTLTGNITKQAPYSGNAVANTAEGNLERRRNIFTIAGVSIADNSMNVKHTTSGIGSHECSLENCGRLPVYSG